MILRCVVPVLWQLRILGLVLCAVLSKRVILVLCPKSLFGGTASLGGG